MRITPGFGMNENVKVATSNSLAPALEMAEPGPETLPAGMGEPTSAVALPVESTMPLVRPRAEPVVVNVPELVVLAPTLKVGAPVRVMPLLPAAMVVANVAALVVDVTVTVAAAGSAKLMSANASVVTQTA